MKKRKKKKKGSSLVIILMVMSVLMILGTSMLSLAVSSYKFRALEQNKKISFYASESGLDEAYVIMSEFVEYGIEQGNKAVEEYDKNFESLIKVERYKVENKKLSEYIDKDGIITKSKVEADREMVFQQGYKVSNIQSIAVNYMEDGVRLDRDCYDKDGTLKEKGYKSFIEDDSIIVGSQGVYKTGNILSKGGIGNLITRIQSNTYRINTSLNDTEDKIAVVAATEIGKDKFDGDKPVTISIKCSYTHNAIPKIVKATYDINVAKYNVQYNLPTQIVKIPKNPIWSKALMVNGDMKINKGEVVIVNGDIYVNGKDGSVETSGIDLTNKDSKLHSNKNIVTNKNLVFSYNEENESKNMVVDENIFCRNLLINETAKGVNLNIKKSLYTLDDLEINAPNSYIDIEDSYYGVSDGSEGERNNPDNSSSIIINTEDIGNRMGDTGKIITHTITNDSVLNIRKNMYIAGTSYINLFKDKGKEIKYQTGESISIVGNYRAYTEALPFTDEYLISNPEANKNIKYKEDNVIFEYIDPLTLVKRYIEGSIADTNPVEAVLEKNFYVTVLLTQLGTENILYNAANSFTVSYNNGTKTSEKTPLGKYIKLDILQNVGDDVSIKLYKDGSPIVDESNTTELDDLKLIAHTELNSFDKSEYFQEYYKQFPTENGLNLGEGIIVNKSITDPSKIENIHAGSIFTSQNSNPQISSGNWNIDLDMKIRARSIQLKNQLFYMGLAKDYEKLASTTNIDDINDITGVGDSNYYKIYGETEPKVTMGTNIDFTKLATENKINNEVILLNSSETTTYLLKGDNSGDISSIINAEIAQKNIDGTSKNLNVKEIDLSSGNDYKGIILTKGNVIITGSLKFTGTIICNGDLTFEGAGKKKITYDKAYLEKFAISNYKLFLDSFKNYESTDRNNYLFAKVYENSTYNDPSSGEKLIKRKKWELIK